MLAGQDGSNLVLNSSLVLQVPGPVRLQGGAEGGAGGRPLCYHCIHTIVLWWNNPDAPGMSITVQEACQVHLSLEFACLCPLS